MSLFTVPVGAPYNELPGNDNLFSCVFGVGPNAGLTGPAIVTTNDDTFLVEKRVGSIGADDYATALANGVEAALPGIGDKAKYFDPGAQGAPDVFAVKGDIECHLAFNLSSDSEVGLPAGLSKPGDALALATKEAALCLDVFGS